MSTRRPVLRPLSRAALTAELLSGAERSFLAGNLVMAGWLCEEIRQVEPDDPGALHLLGLIAERERRLTDASTLWRQALASHPHFTPAWLSLATLHRIHRQPRSGDPVLSLPAGGRSGGPRRLVQSGQCAVRRRIGRSRRRSLSPRPPARSAPWRVVAQSGRGPPRAGTERRERWTPCAGRWHTGPTIRPAITTSP